MRPVQSDTEDDTKAVDTIRSHLNAMHCASKCWEGDHLFLPFRLQMYVGVREVERERRPILCGVKNEVLTFIASTFPFIK